MFRNITLQCLTEVAAVTVPNYDAAFAGLFSKTMAQLVQVHLFIFIYLCCVLFLILLFLDVTHSYKY